MKTGQLYIQVFIGGEESLPKEEGIYFVVTNEQNHAIYPFSNEDVVKKLWMKFIDWYLLPVKDSLREEGKLYQCPYSKATKCDLKDCCLECETFGEYLSTIQPEEKEATEKVYLCSMKGKGYCPHELDNGQCEYTASCVNKQVKPTKE